MARPLRRHWGYAAASLSCYSLPSRCSTNSLSLSFLDSRSPPLPLSLSLSLSLPLLLPLPSSISLSNRPLRVYLSSVAHTSPPPPALSFRISATPDTRSSPSPLFRYPPSSLDAVSIFVLLTVASLSLSRCFFLDRDRCPCFRTRAPPVTFSWILCFFLQCPVLFFSNIHQPGFERFVCIFLVFSANLFILFLAASSFRTLPIPYSFRRVSGFVS